MSRVVLVPWEVSEQDYPGNDGPEEQLRFLLRYAVLAPSGHNTQPWRFRVKDRRVDVFADRSRALPVVDPQDRELLMSCGAAIFHLRLAIRYFGFRAELDLGVDPSDADLLARVRVGEREDPSPDDIALFRAIPLRRTHRKAFLDRPLPEEFLTGLERHIQEEGAWLLQVRAQKAREGVADLVAEGDRLQGADREFRKELAAWIRHNRSGRGDGMPGYALGIGSVLSYLGPFVMRHTNWGRRQAFKTRSLALAAPALVVVGTDGETREDWLRAGQALARLLLRARSADVSASHLNQPIEVPQLRGRLQNSLRITGYPQLILRLGYGRDVTPTPRRSVEHVVM